MSKHLISSPGSNYINNCYPPTSAQPGSVWFDSGTQTLKTYDGTMWYDVDPPQVTLAWEAEQAIDHIISKMNEQKELARLSAKYPIVADALGQLEVALKLCQNLEDSDK